MSLDKSRACDKSLSERSVLPLSLGLLIMIVVAVFAFGGQWAEVRRVAADESIHLSEPQIREAMDETFVPRIEHAADMQIINAKLDAIAKAVGAHIDE